MSRAWVRAAQALGYQRDFDLEHPEREGVGFYPRTTTIRGERWSAATGYLRPAIGRPNLEVCTHSSPTRILIADGVATGVEITHGGRTEVIRAER